MASGLEFIWLEVEIEYDLRGGGVSSCTTCDGFLYAKKHVVVVEAKMLSF
jgi:thioredoxin reductase (NADPH)